jgi:hypothetical protein
MDADRFVGTQLALSDFKGEQRKSLDIWGSNLTFANDVDELVGGAAAAAKGQPALGLDNSSLLHLYNS